MGKSKLKATTSDCLLNISDSDKDAAPPSPSSLLNPSAETKPAETEERKTFRVQPPSGLLSRLQEFLPQIAVANQKLEETVAEDPDKLNIENVGEDEPQYIEMDLGLGVFDMKPKKKEGADDIVIGTRRASDGSDSEDDEGVSSQLFGSKVVIDPSSILHGKGPKPNIEVLGEKNGSGSGMDK
ncbi:hypothetical protein FBU59_006016 [Linderina macrospora]|uniref:Uncharacterized protein n=1 Tax=Linderina macrospora TaxID=4868 RepID=A0ACC1J0Y4_9FUNG|nr:hypothetical protein FBU59_006016 [Linderina macrospora]